jgi:hypothetical protein
MGIWVYGYMGMGLIGSYLLEDVFAFGCTYARLP